MNKKAQYTEIYFLLFEILMVLLFAATMFSWTNNTIGSDSFVRNYIAVDSGLVVEMIQNAPGNFIFHYGTNKSYLFEYSGGYKVCDGVCKSDALPIPLAINKLNLGKYESKTGFTNPIFISGSAKTNNIIRFLKSCKTVSIFDKDLSPKSEEIERYFESC